MTNDELNRLMAELCGGVSTWHGYTLGYTWPDGTFSSNWNPATDANDALRVLGELGEKGISFTIYRNIVQLYDYETDTQVGDAFYDGTNSLCRAICEAAAKAVGVEP